jgi:hypothetical protein
MWRLTVHSCNFRKKILWVCRLLIPKWPLRLLHILPIWLFGSCCIIEWWSYTLLLSFAGFCGKRRSGVFRPQFKGAKGEGAEQGNGRWNWLAWEVWAKVNNLLQQIGQAGGGDSKPFSLAAWASLHCHFPTNGTSRLLHHFLPPPTILSCI